MAKNRVDLARQGKLLKGEVANYEGSMKLGENLDVSGNVLFHNVGQSGSEKHVLLVDFTGLVQTIPLSQIEGGGGTNPQPSGSSRYTGDYNRQTTYRLGDMVTHEGALYIWTSNATGADIAPPNPTFWTLLATAGGDGQDGKGFEVIFKAVVKESDITTPVAPINDPSLDNNIPSDWNANLIPPTKQFPYVFQSKRTKVNGIWGAYSTPVLWSVFFEGGEGSGGTGGTNIQYIYRRFADEQTDLTITPSTLPERENDNYIPTNWYTPQKGVSSSFRFEYISKRVKTGTSAWSEWNDPVLWATYSANGADGKDGKNIEFVFKRVVDESAIATLPPPPYNNTDGQVPSGWTDDPTGVTIDFRAEAYTMRTKPPSQAWSAWSTPLAWSRFNVDGLDGKGTERIYKRTTLNVRPDNPIEPSDHKIDGYVPSEIDINGDYWTAQPTGVAENKQFEWVSQRIKVSQYNAQGEKESVWSNFSIPALSSHFGRNGRDGTDIEFIYRLVKEENDPSILVPPPNNPSIDDFVPYGWTDDPSGTDTDFKFEYVATREKKGDVWEGFSKPALWSKYGDDGKDGKDIEFVYITTSTKTPPVKPKEGTDYTQTEYQVDDFVPSSPDQWNDNPIGITEIKPYLWMMRRIRVNDLWQEFSNPILYGLPGKDGVGTPGDTGDTYERRYRSTSDPVVAPAYNKTDRNPSGFTIQPPTISIGFYLWMIEARITSAGQLVGEWSNAVRVSPVDGKSSNGKDGEIGPYVVFRGDFNRNSATGALEIKQYYGGKDRLEVVRSAGKFYISKIDAGTFTDNSPTPTTGQNGKWNTFQNNFESVATGILFAELAYIDNLSVRYLRTAQEDGGTRVEINRGGNNNIELYKSGDANDNPTILIDDDGALHPKDGFGAGIRVGNKTEACMMITENSISLISREKVLEPNGDYDYKVFFSLGRGIDGGQSASLKVDYVNVREEIYGKRASIGEVMSANRIVIGGWDENVAGITVWGGAGVGLVRGLSGRFGMQTLTGKKNAYFTYVHGILTNVQS